MLKIGLVDYYLDNWHANEYPGFLREAIVKHGYDARLTAAFALHDKPGGMTTDEWCRHHDVTQAPSMAALLDGVDAVMVIAADDSRWHDEVCPAPLQCGKPVYVDKTFAYDLAGARRLFALADESGTPVFSSSAQRYCQSILDYQECGQRAYFVSTVGPHSLDNYAVHQLEPIVELMGPGIRRVKAFAMGEDITQLILDYGDGRWASFMQAPNPFAEFNFMVSDGEQGQRLESADYYPNLMKTILDFFFTGEIPVPHRETLEIIAVIEAARAARQKPDEWITLITE